MASRSNIGGVFGVDIWLATDSGRSNPPTPLSSVRIPIISSKCSYSESSTISGSKCLVEHTLTLVTMAQDNFWGDAALESADSVGCIARVELSSRGKILLGWSAKLGYDQPLRLIKVSTLSGTAVNEEITKEWVFKSYSTTALI